MNTHKILLLVSLLSLVAGCTRKAEDNKETTQIQLSLPSTAAMSKSMSAQAVTYMVKHLVVNVTADGVTTVCEWDASGSKSGPCDVAFPTVQLDVPAGTNRMIQVLTVYDSTGGQLFKYGDAVANISAGNATVPVVMSDLSTTSSGAMGDIKGRFLTASNVGPTGTLITRLLPPGKPSMVLTQTEMLNGWFNAFSISGVKMTYQVNGQDLFATPMQLEDFINDTDVVVSTFTPGDSGLVKSTSYGPTAQARYTLGGGGGGGPQYSIVGFFSNGFNISSYSTLSTGSCSVNEYSTCLSVGNTGNDYSRIRGVFKKPTAGASSLFSFVSGVLSWSFLNGITSADMEGVKIYQINNMTQSLADSFVIHHETVNCETMAAMALAGTATQLADVGALGTSAGGLPNINGFTQAFAICPYKGTVTKTPLNAGALYPADWLDGQGCSSCKGLWPLVNGGTGPSNDVMLTVGVCHSGSVSVSNAYGPQNVSTSTTVTLPSIANVTWYSDSGCTSTITTTTIAISTSSAPFYVKATAVVSPTVMNFGISGDTTVGVSPSLGLLSAGPGSLQVVQSPTNVVSNECYPILVRRNFFSGMPDTSGALPATASGNQAGVIDPSISCTGGGSFTFNASYSEGTFYYKPTAALGVSETVTISASGYGSTTMNSVVKNSSSVVNSVEVHADFPPLEVGMCEQMSVVLRNFDGAQIRAPSTMTFQVNALTEMGQFFSDGACTTASNTVTFSSGTMSQSIFFKPLRTQTGGLSVLFYLSGTSLQLYNSGSVSSTVGYTIDDPNNSSNYLYVEVPSNLIGKRYLGSHEFTGPGNTLAMPLRKPADALLECSNDSGATYSSATCTSLGIYDGAQFTWPKTGAIALTVYWMRSARNGSTVLYKFQPNVLFGPGFKTFNCDQLITSNKNSNDVAFNFETYPVTCIAAGVTVSFASTPLTVGGTSLLTRALLGHSAGTSTIDVGATGSAVGAVIGDQNNYVYIANLNFVNGNSGTLIDLPSASVTTSTAEVYVHGNVFHVYNNGIRVATSDPDYSKFYIENNTFTIYHSSGSPVHAGVLATSNPQLYIENNVFNGSASSNTYPIRGVMIDSSPSNSLNSTKNIKNNSFHGLGTGLEVIGNSTYQVSGLTVAGNKFDSSGAGDTSHDPFIRLKAVGSVDFSGNVLHQLSLVTTAGFHLMELDHPSSGGNGFQYFRDNVFINGGNGNATGFIYSMKDITINTNGFSGNHFVLTTAVSNASTWFPFYQATGTTASISVPSGAYFHGNNLLCRNANVGSNPYWTNMFGGGGTISGGNIIEADVLTRCKFDTSVNSSAVTTANRCGLPCN